MRFHILPVVIFCMVCSACTMQNQQDHWQALFNGEDLTGWSHVGEGTFVVENGFLKSEGGMGLLWYEDSMFQNVHLRVVYRTLDGTNSGVFIRIPKPPADPWLAVHKGYEVQIDDSGDAFHSTGVLYSLTEAKARPGASDDGWNTMDIYLNDLRTQVYVNDVLITDYREGEPVAERKAWWEPERGPRPARGYIGLQNHDDKSVVWVRDVLVRPMDQK